MIVAVKNLLVQSAMLTYGILRIKIPDHIPTGGVIGKNGNTIKKIRCESSAKVYVRSTERQVIIRGSAASIKKAGALIQSVFDQHRQCSVAIPESVPVGHIIGRSGCNIKYIEAVCGVHISINEKERIISFYGLDKALQLARHIYAQQIQFAVARPSVYYDPEFSACMLHESFGSENVLFVPYENVKSVPSFLQNTKTFQLDRACDGNLQLGEIDGWSYITEEFPNHALQLNAMSAVGSFLRQHEFARATEIFRKAYEKVKGVEDLELVINFGTQLYYQDGPEEKVAPIMSMTSLTQSELCSLRIGRSLDGSCDLSSCFRKQIAIERSQSIANSLLEKLGFEHQRKELLIIHLTNLQLNTTYICTLDLGTDPMTIFKIVPPAARYALLGIVTPYSLNLLDFRLKLLGHFPLTDLELDNINNFLSRCSWSDEGLYVHNLDYSEELSALKVTSSYSKIVNCYSGEFFDLKYDVSMSQAFDEVALTSATEISCTSDYANAQLPNDSVLASILGFSFALSQFSHVDLPQQ